jgi:uncharacterized membrane protein YcjF (UPF0283 family)
MGWWGLGVLLSIWLVLFAIVAPLFPEFRRLRRLWRVTRFNQSKTNGMNPC